MAMAGICRPDFRFAAEGGLLLASASQDKLVRIWAIQPALQVAERCSNTENGHVPEKDLAKSLARSVLFGSVGERSILPQCATYLSGNPGC